MKLTTQSHKHSLCILFYFLFSSNLSYSQSIYFEDQFDSIENWEGSLFTTGSEAEGWYIITPEKTLQSDVSGGSGVRTLHAYYEQQFFANEEDTLEWYLSIQHHFSVSDNLQRTNQSRLVLFQNDSIIVDADTLVYVEVSNTIRLVKEINGEDEVLIEFSDVFIEEEWYALKVMKSGSEWRIILNDVFVGSVVTEVSILPSHFYVGLQSLFSSSSRGQSFEYDNYRFIKKEAEEDIKPPFLESYTLKSLSILTLYFNESLDPLYQGNIFLNDIELLPNYYFIKDNEVELNNEFQIDSIYNITLKDFRDKYDNQLLDTTFSVFVEDIYPPHLDTLIINDDLILNLSFSEKLYSLVENQINIYVDQDSIDVESVSLIDGNTWRVILSEPLWVNKNHLLSIKELKDEPGNTDNINYLFHNDKKAPRYQSLNITSDSLLVLYFNENISDHTLTKYQFTIRENNFPKDVKVNQNIISLVFEDGFFDQNQSYTLKVEGIEDLFGNRMSSKNLIFEFDTIPPEIVEVRYLDSLVKVRWNDKISSFQTSSRESSSLECISNSTFHVLTDELTLINIEDDNQNLKDTLVISIDSNKVIYNGYFKSDSTVIIQTNKSISTEEIRSNKLFNSIHQKSKNTFEIRYSTHFNEEDSIKIKLRNDSLTIQNDVNEIVAYEILNDHTIVLEFEEYLSSLFIPQIENDFNNSVEHVYIKEQSLQIIFKDSFLENENHKIDIQSLHSCNGRTLQDYSFTFNYDTKPPKLLLYDWEDTHILKLTYDENIDLNSFQRRLKISDSLSFNLRKKDNTILIEFEKENWMNDISIEIDKGVKDEAGNATEILTSIFIKKILKEATNRVVLSEVLIDPSPSVGLPLGEAIEIYNRSDDTLNLMSLKLSISDHIIDLPNMQLTPMQYGVLVAENDAHLWSKYTNVFCVKKWNTLNNNEDKIYLLNGLDSTIIDSLHYDLSFYQNKEKQNGGFSLERRDLTFNCDHKINWMASEDTSGGTFGVQNSVFEIIKDSLSPNIINIDVVDNNRISIYFNEKVYSDSLESTIVYTVSNVGNSVNKWKFVDNYTLELLINNDLPSGMLITLTVDNFFDCFNNKILSKNTNFIIKPKVNYQQLLITELMINHSPINKLPESEYIELYNNSERIIGLDKCTMLVDDQVLKLPDNWIFPREYLVMCPLDKKHFFDSLGIKAVGIESWKDLNNKGGLVQLKNENDKLIHSVAYDRSYYKDNSKLDGGWSIEMRDISVGCLGSQNWQATLDQKGGTPSSENSILEVVNDFSPPNVENVIYDQDHSQISVMFDEKIVYDSQSTLIVGEKIIDESEINVIDNILSINFYNNKKGNLEIEIQGIKDCLGNRLSRTKHKVYFKNEEKKLLLSEILYDPGVLNTDFIELYLGVEEGYINLNDWSLARIKEGELVEEVTLSSSDLFLIEEGYYVFTDDKSLLQNYYPHLENEKVFEISIPTFTNEEGEVVLLYKEEIIETFLYSDKLHQSFLNNTEDISLERINYHVSSTNINNWLSATEDVGFATPTFINSRFLENKASTNDQLMDQLLLSPSLITSNGDGVDDYLILENRGSNVVKIMRLEIFDSQGHLIFPWVNNYELSSGNFIRWDAIDLNGARVVGKFLVYLEVINGSGIVEKTVKVVSVAPWN